jgi:hypothetical protein
MEARYGPRPQHFESDRPFSSTSPIGGVVDNTKKAGVAHTVDIGGLSFRERLFALTLWSAKYCKAFVRV